MPAVPPIGPAPSPPAWMGRDDPWFHARHTGSRVTVDGTPACSLGHRIPRGAPPDDGIFAEWRWDGTSLAVTTDRYGAYPLYYHATDDEVAISPSIVRLLAIGAPPDLDDDALGIFVRLGWFIGEDTPFAKIRAMPPHGTLIWKPGSLSVSGQRLEPPAPLEVSREAAIDRYVALFREAMARRIPARSDFVVPLSGGRDSRHILLELMATGRRPSFCITARHVPPRNNEDAAVAAALCARLGVPHVVVDQPGSGLAAERAKNERTGFCADEHAWYMAVADHLSERTACVFDGLAGSVLSAGSDVTPKGIELMRSERYEDMAASLFRPREAAAGRFLTPDGARRLDRDRAIARMAAELRALRDWPNPIAAYKFWHRNRREIILQTHRLLPPSTTIFEPYLDHDLWDFLMSLPAEHVVDRGLHTETINAAYPAYADIPFASWSGREPHRGHMRRFARELAWFALRGGTGRLVDGRRVARKLARGMVTGNHAALDGLRTSIVILLLQVERIAAGDAPAYFASESPK